MALAARVALVAASALDGLPSDRSALYSDMILAALSAAARKDFEMLPHGYEFKSDVGRNGQIRGRLESKAEDILEILDARGLAVTEEQRHRIENCQDFDTLRTWIRKAAVVASTDKLFDE